MHQEINRKSNKGFTLIEMLVSIAIFSIVLVVIMGTIVTIVDTNRKARTMTEVMNNVNFAIESMTRTLKTSTTLDVTGNNIIATDQFDNVVKYSFIIEDSESNPGVYTLYKQIEDGTPIQIISDDVEITDLKIGFFEYGAYNQPRVFFSFKGTVRTAKGISSEFNIQTTVSQRQLEID